LIRSLAVVARDRTDGRFVRAAGFLKSRAGSEAVRLFSMKYKED